MKAQQGRSGRLFPRLQDFIGEWRVSRDIAHADGTTACFEGQAVFAPGSGILRYHEAGELRLGSGQEMHAERSYVWSEREDGALEVFFEDGRPFHQIIDGASKAEHWCDPDTYEVTYRFENWPDWSCRWQVRGPRKDYCMTTHYSRASLLS